MVKKIVCAAIVAMMTLCTPVYASDEPAAAAPVYTTTRVNLRTSPQIEEDNILSTIAMNTELTILEFGEEWDKVLYNDVECYIYNSYLSLEKTELSVYSPAYFRKMGVINWNGMRFTWYSEKVLPGGGLKIPGRHTTENGYVCDENDYVVIAHKSLPKGTVIQIPFHTGYGIVLDRCPIEGTYDVYVSF